MRYSVHSGSAFFVLTWVLEYVALVVGVVGVGWGCTRRACDARACGRK